MPESAPLAPGQHENFHYLTLDIDPLLVKVQRLKTSNQANAGNSASTAKPTSRAQPLELQLKNPPLALVEEMVSRSGGLQLQGYWVDERTPHIILSHLFETAKFMGKLDIDTLMMCENALPCVIFSREESSGAPFNEGEWNQLKLIAKPYLIEKSER
mgnify:CR=1 FL=1